MQNNSKNSKQFAKQKSKKEKLAEVFEAKKKKLSTKLIAKPNLRKTSAANIGSDPTEIAYKSAIATR